MVSLTWPHVNAWRLSRQHLLQRAERGKLLEVVSNLGGVQAQVMSAAEMAGGARVDGLAPADIQNALWRDRSLIKTWAMRISASKARIRGTGKSVLTNMATSFETVEYA